MDVCIPLAVGVKNVSVDQLQITVKGLTRSDKIEEELRPALTVLSGRHSKS